MNDDERPVYILSEGQAASAWAVGWCLLLLGALFGWAVCR